MVLTPLHREPTERLAVMGEVRPQHLRHHEDPLRVPYLLQHILRQQRRCRRPALGGARRAQVTGLARKGEQVLGVTLRALDAGETVLEKAAVLVPPHLLVDQAAPVAVPPLEALLPLRLDLVEVGLDKSVQGGVARGFLARYGAAQTGATVTLDVCCNVDACQQLAREAASGQLPPPAQ
jgi:hypothetical protein